MSTASKIATLRYKNSQASEAGNGPSDVAHEYHKMLLENSSSKTNYDRHTRLLCQLTKCRTASLVFVALAEARVVSEHSTRGSIGKLEGNFCQNISLDVKDLQVVDDVAAQCSSTCHIWKDEAPAVRSFAVAAVRVNQARLCYLIVTDDVPRSWSPDVIASLLDISMMLGADLEIAQERHLTKTQKTMQRSLVQFVRGNLRALGTDKDFLSNPNPTRSLCSDLDEDIEVDDADEEVEQTEVSKMNVMFDLSARLIRRTLKASGCLVLNIENLTDLENISAAFPSRSTVMGACFLKHLRTVDWHQKTSGSISSGRGSENSASVQSDTFSSKSVPRNDVFDTAGLSGVWLKQLLENHPRAVAFEEPNLPKDLKKLLPAGLRSCLLSPIYDSNAKAFALILVFNDCEGNFSKTDCHYIEAFGSSIYAEVLNQSLQRANEAKALFISKISHEFRTPLHGVLASAEFLNDMPDITAAQRSFVQTIDSCGRTLLDIINHVLDYSKLNFGNNVLPDETTTDNVTLEEFDIINVAEEVLTSAYSAYEFKRINDHIDVFKTNSQRSQSCSDSGSLSEALGRNLEVVFIAEPIDCGYMVLADLGAFRRIVLNLLGNALKYTPSGHVTLRITLKPGASEGLRELEIAISDTGIGIDQAFLIEMFKPFTQEDQFSTGTGLGLSIVKELCTKLHGHIGVATRKGIGSTFKISMPVIGRNPAATLFPGEGLKRDLRDIKFHYASVGEETLSDPLHIASTRMLKSTTIAHLESWYGMKHVSWSDAEILLTDTVTFEAELEKVTHFPGPILTLCSTTTKYERSMKNFQNKITQTFLTKPFGPIKLGECLVSCLSTSRTLSRLTIMNEVPISPISGLSEESPPMYHEDSPPASLSSTVRPTREHTNITGGSRRVVREESDAQSLADLYNLTQNMQISADHDHDSNVNGMDKRGSTEFTACSVANKDADKSHVEQAVDVVDDNAVPLSQESAIKRKHVLIVEDNPINMMLLVSFAKRRGLAVTTAINGELACSKVQARSRNFDVILMDINMPIMNGFEATKAIRAFEVQSGRSSSKIIALTGLSTPEDQARATKAGVDNFFTKPVKMKALAELLVTWNVLEPSSDPATPNEET